MECSRLQLHSARLGALVLVAALLAACEKPAAETLELAPAPPPTASARPVADAGATSADDKATLMPALVLELDGETQVKHAGSDSWLALKLGDKVIQGDQVRSGTDSHLVFGIGDARITMKDSSRLAFQILDPRSVRASVGGEVEAVSTQGQEPIELATEDGVTGRVSAGKLLMRALEPGRTQLAALDGTAAVESAGGTVELKEGELGILRQGKLANRSRLPKRVTLHVRWPPNDATNQAQLDLGGQVSALAQVRVQGHTVQAQTDGSFQAKVPLKLGRQRVAVVATDPLGRSVEQSRSILLDPKAPSIKASVQYH
jgi:hypothetical protein